MQRVSDSDIRAYLYPSDADEACDVNKEALALDLRDCRAELDRTRDELAALQKDYAEAVRALDELRPFQPPCEAQYLQRMKRVLRSKRALEVLEVKP